LQGDKGSPGLHRSFNYDANGNMTQRVIGGNTYTLSYDAENRLVSVTGPSMSATFTYDGDGNRVKFPINGTITTFVGNYYEVSGSTVTKYYFAGASRVAMSVNGTMSYLLSDQLGSTSITTNAAGTKIAELRYKAWGEVRCQNGTTLTWVDTATIVYSECMSAESIEQAYFVLEG
jgi:YD repeat-containing protein